jgi:hypothetical protein
MPENGQPHSSLMSGAWKIATPGERTRIARQLFVSVVTDNRTAVAVIPRPDLRPFFVSVAVKSDEKECISGSDGDRIRIGVTVTAISSLPRLRPWNAWAALAALKHRAGSMAHQQRLKRKHEPWPHTATPCERSAGRLGFHMRRYGASCTPPSQSPQSDHAGNGTYEETRKSLAIWPELMPATDRAI